MLSRSAIIGKIKASAYLPTKYLIKYGNTHHSYDTNLAKVPNDVEILTGWYFPLRMPNGLIHFWGTDGGYSNIIYNPTTKTYISLSATTEYPSAYTSRPCFNADGSQIFIVRYYGDTDIRIAVYNTSDFSLISEYDTPFTYQSAPALGNVNVMYNLGNNQLLLIAGNGKYIYNYITRAYTTVSASATGHDLNTIGNIWAYASTSSPYLRRVSMPDNTILSALATMPTGAVRDVAFSPNGNLFACVQSTGSTRRLLVYNTNDWGMITATPTLTTYAMYSCAFSDDSQYLFIVTNSATEGLLVYRTSDWSKVTIVGNFAGNTYSMSLRPATIT